MKRILFLVLLVAALALVGCTRSASTPPPGDSGSGESTGGGDIPFPTPESGESGLTDEMSTAVAGGFATQTAMASGNTSQDLVLETAVPEPTQQEPTAVPPTDEPAKEQSSSDSGGGQSTAVDCSSPYTVKKGDWVWDIGRRCNIHPNSIISANNLRWPYTIYPGDQLVLPANAPAFP